MRKFSIGVLITFCFLLGSISVKADSYLIHIERQHTDIPIEVSLSEYPVITFDNGTLIISANQIECDLSDIKTWYFIADTPTQVNSEHALQSVCYNNNVFTVTGEVSSNLQIYDINGIKQYPATNSTDNTITIDLNGLADGVYIIKIGTQSYKVNKK